MSGRASVADAPVRVLTPWGDADTLRDRKLRPGTGGLPEEVEKNQRERLFAAMIACVSRRGYAATRVSDLVEISGVSSRSFYDLFEDKSACFQATIEGLLAVVFDRASVSREGTWEERARLGTRSFAELIVAQPAAARACLIEAFAAGPRALRPLRETAARFEAHLRQMIAESPERADLPPEIATAYVGALTELARTRLRRGKEAELPGLIDDLSGIVLSYTSPPEPLRLTARRPSAGPETLDAYDHAERALRAFSIVVSERGYENTTIDQVVKRASMSATTFYANFSGKEDAMLAAVESAGAQMMAAILPAFRRSPDWRIGVRAALGALFSFLASRPALARLVMVEVYAAGPVALDRRAETLRQLEVILAEGRRRAPDVPPVAFEAISGGIYSLAYRTIDESGPEALPGLAPICAYIALAPFVGPEEACAVANGEVGARVGPPANPELIRAVTNEPLRQMSLTAVSLFEAATLAQIAEELGQPPEHVAHHVAELERAGLVEEVKERNPDGEVLYRTNMRQIDTEQWARLPIDQREAISRQVGELIKGDVESSLRTGYFDKRVERALSRAPVLLDEQGWRELSKIQTELIDAALEVQARSIKRLEASGEEPINARSIQALFEMPPH